LPEVTGFSSIFDECDLISIDCPITIKVCMSSTLSALRHKRYDAFIPKLAFFDSAVSVIQRLTSFCSFPSFYNFELALECSRDACEDNGRFMSEYLYDLSDAKLWDQCSSQSMQSDYPLPCSFSEKVVLESLGKFPSLDDPYCFGHARLAFSLFYSKLMEVDPIRECCDVPLIESDPKFRTEVFLLTRFSSIGHAIPFFSQRPEQIQSNSQVVDFALLVAPDVFMMILKYLFIQSHDIVSEPVIVLEEQPIQGIQDGVLVNGLVVQEGKFENGKFDKHHANSELPVLWMHSMEEPKANHRRATFLQNGSPVSALFIECADGNQESVFNIFSRPV